MAELTPQAARENNQSHDPDHAGTHDHAAGDGDVMLKLPQEVEITDAGPCKKHVKVTVGREAIDARLEEKYSDLMTQTPAQINGFRPGKAPRKIVEKRYKSEVTAEVKTQVLMASLEQLAEEQSLSPLSPPELDPDAVRIPDDGPLVYEFNIEVRPEFDLPDYKSLKLRKPVHTFTDAEVDAEGKRMLEPFGRVVPKDGDNAAVELEDLITTDVVIKRGEKELNRVSEIRLKVEPRLALSDGVAETFGATLTGAKVGDTRTVEITLATDGPTAVAGGGTVSAAFTVKDIKVNRPPELTQSVFDSFDVHNEDQFKELARKRLDRLLEYSQRQTARTQVMQILGKDANFDLPRDLLLRQARKTLQRRVMEMRSAGMTDDQIVGRQRVLEQDAVRTTAEALKEHFVLQKIAETEKLEVEDADIDDEIDRIADQTGDSPRKVRAKMERDELLEALATELLERKALDLVLGTAEYEEFEQNPLTRDAGDVTTVDAQADPAAQQAALADAATAAQASAEGAG